MKKAFLLLSEPTHKLVLSLLRNPDNEIFTVDSFGQKAGHFKIIHLDAQEKKRINYETFNQVTNFYSTYIKNTLLGEEFEKHNFNAWFYHKFRIYFDVRNVLYEVELIRKIQKEYDQIEVFGAHPFTNEIIKGGGIICHPASKKKVKAKAIINLGIVLLFRFLSGVRTRCKIENKILVLDTKESYTNLRLKNGGVKLRNAQIEYLLSSGHTNSFVLLDRFNLPKLAGAFHAKGKFWKKYYKIPGVKEEQAIGWFNFRIRGAAKAFRTKVHDLFETITPVNETDELIKLVLRRLGRSTEFFYNKFLGYVDYFKENRPSVTLITDEYSPNNRVIVDAARVNQVKTASFQHGSIHDLHPGYVLNNADPIDRIIPDLIIVWGEKWKQFLESHGFPGNMIKVAGQLRTDIINELSENPPDKGHMLGPESKDRKIVLFASQPQRDEFQRKMTAQSVFEAVKSFEEFLLVLKLHPGENDPAYYEDIARSAGCMNFRIVKEIDLYELLTIADVLITSFSTVGTEAVYFKKPILIYDPLRQDILGLKSAGVASQCTSSEEIKNYLTQILGGIYLQDKEKIEKFIKDNVFKIDGKTADRYFELLNTN